MAGADVIEAAIGITLLLIVSYVVIGSITAAAGTVSSAQNDITQREQDRLGTSIAVADYHCQWSYWDGQDIYSLHFRVLNTGNRIITNPAQMTVMLIRGSDRPLLYKYGDGSYGTMTWYYDGNFDIDIYMTNEIINPGQWDPGEYLYGRMDVNFSPAYTDNIQVVLANGANAMNTNSVYWS
jgi:archaellum component FlaG (FlaF/FlaG flagellin family)